MELVVSERARIQITNIRYYTLEMWGERQLEKYTMLLENALYAIKQNPKIGKKRPAFPEHILTVKAGRHFICYRFEKNEIFVTSVLHEKMDVSRHLD